jgi:hypothetical protein
MSAPRRFSAAGPFDKRDAIGQPTGNSVRSTSDQVRPVGVDPYAASGAGGGDDAEHSAEASNQGIA